MEVDPDPSQLDPIYLAVKAQHRDHLACDDQEPTGLLSG
jgi:hypothetical protein